MPKSAQVKTMTALSQQAKIASHGQDIVISLHGHEIRGIYEVKDDFVVVTCKFGSHRARRGGIRDEHLAMIALKDLAKLNLTN
jgi:hypothetical protein